MPLDAAIIGWVFAPYCPWPQIRHIMVINFGIKIELLCIVTIAFLEAREKGTKRTPLYSADRSDVLRRKVERHDYIYSRRAQLTFSLYQMLTTDKSSLSYQTPKKLVKKLSLPIKIVQAVYIVHREYIQHEWRTRFRGTELWQLRSNLTTIHTTFKMRKKKASRGRFNVLWHVSITSLLSSKSRYITWKQSFPRKSY